MVLRCLACAFTLTLVLICLSLPARSRAAAYLPPAGRVYTGITAGDPLTYELETRAHAAIFQEFVTWGGTIGWALAPATQNNSRAMLAIQTITPSGGEVISPGAIARGQGDAWLEWLGATLAQRGQPVYVRLFAEMDAYWNPYSAYNKNGTFRGTDHSTQAFRQAWRRITLILRGGPVSAIDAQLRALRMPPVAPPAAVAPGSAPAAPAPAAGSAPAAPASAAGSAPAAPASTPSIPAVLPAAPVAMLWVPQVWGAPDTAQNAPRAYYPGGQYVDWVGTDFYSEWPNWRGLNSFFAEFPGKPFVFGEWAITGGDNPAFVNQLFGWIAAHPRVRILMYNQGYKVAGPLALARYPASARAISRQLHKPRFAPFTPEWHSDS